MTRDSYSDLVNSTCRTSGAVGSMAIVPRVVPEFAKKSDKILDFGAGKFAVQTNALQNKGYHVTAFEIGRNFNPRYHDKNALNKKYDLVYASNVLNVQPTRGYIDMVLNTVNEVLREGGLFIANYPSEPRKCKGLGVTDVKNLLEKHFTYVERVKKTKTMPKLNVPVWVCQK